MAVPRYVLADRRMWSVKENWDVLTRYCEDADLEIDNNGAERSLRGVAVGRNNWLFFGSDNGGRAAAILTGFIATGLTCSGGPSA